MKGVNADSEIGDLRMLGR